MNPRLAVLRRDARDAWAAGIAAVDPSTRVALALSERKDLAAAWPRTLVVAIGKASPGMMRGALAAFGSGRSPLGSIVLLPRGLSPGLLPSSTLVLHGGHPVPSEEGWAASQRIVREVEALGEGQRLLFLLSGGASALFDVPAAGLRSADLGGVHRMLVGSGLPIASINLVRSCLSAVKGGGLGAAAFPAAVTTLAISDVEGDDPAVIGSAPTLRGQRTRAEACRDAIAVLAAAAIRLGDAAERVLRDGAAQSGEAPAAAAERTTTDADYEVVASVADAVAGAKRFLREKGYAPAARDDYWKGETAAAAASLLAVIDAEGRATAAALVRGGETTVALTTASPGRGGRNLDVAARLALGLAGRTDVAAAVGGSDGCDGSSRAAGAVVDGGTSARAEAAGFPLAGALAAFDTEPALEAAGALMVTGPSGTNVGDLVVLLKGRA